MEYDLQHRYISSGVAPCECFLAGEEYKLRKLNEKKIWNIEKRRNDQSTYACSIIHGGFPCSYIYEGKVGSSLEIIYGIGRTVGTNNEQFVYSII